METLRSNFELKYWVLRTELVSIHNYHEIPSATLNNRWQPYGNASDTFGNPEYSNYLLFKCFFPTDTKQQQKMETTDHLFESIHCVYSNKSRQNTNIPATTVTQIPSYYQRYLGCLQHQIPNTVKYRQILYGN